MVGMIPRKGAEGAKPEAKQEQAHVAAATQAQPEASSGTAVAARPTSAVSAQLMGRPRPVVQEMFKDALRVEWNTLHRMQAVQGNFVDVENNKKEVGKTIVAELLSYQDNFQISPGTDADEDAQHVRYSDDGVTTTQGENCQEYLTALKEANYVNARMTKRVTLAMIVSEADDPALVGQMVQIDLPPTSKNMFDRFQMQASLDVARGVRSESQINPIRMTARTQSKGKNTWTVVEFAYGS